MKPKIISVLAIVLTVAVAGDALAYSGSSKGAVHTSQICKDKLGAKNVAKADRKAEYTKCMSDPDGYK